MLGLRFCARAFSSCGERGPLFIAVRGPLTIAASPAVEHRLQTHRLSSCGSRAQLLRGMWDLPRPGLEPVSPALAGRFSTTAPPGKPKSKYFYLGSLCPRSESGCVSKASPTQDAEDKSPHSVNGRGRESKEDILCVPPAGSRSPRIAPDVRGGLLRGPGKKYFPPLQPREPFQKEPLLGALLSLRLFPGC